MEANQNLLIEGNLFVEGGGVPVVPTLGTHQVNVNYTVPVQAQGISTSGSTGPSAESIAAAVLAALQATTIPVNIKQVNDVTVQGAGTKLNPWQPV